MSVAQPLSLKDRGDGVLPKKIRIVKKSVVARATRYGFVYWSNPKTKKLRHKKERIWQQRDQNQTHL